MTREDALRTVLDKWNLEVPKPYEHGDCAEMTADYIEARTGKRPVYDKTRELTVAAVKEVLGPPRRDGEVGLLSKGLFLPLPNGGIAVCFEEIGHFARLGLNKGDFAKRVMFFKGDD